MIGFRTGSDARLQVTFRDNSVLTLGEKANVIVDRNVFDPEKSKGEEKRLTNNFRDNLYNQYLDRESNTFYLTQAPRQVLQARGGAPIYSVLSTFYRFRWLFCR
jgi:hypothetical protein